MTAEVCGAEHKLAQLRNDNEHTLQNARDNYAREKKRGDSKLLKDNLDDTLMYAKALKAGVKVLKSQDINTLKYTAIDSSNTTAVLAQAFASFKEVQNEIEK